MEQRRQVRTGVTIVEVLAALVLAGMLMVALTGVLRSWGAQKEVLAEKHQPALWQMQLEEQLRWDLQNSRLISVAAGELRLSGYGSRDAASGMSTMREAEVNYRVEANSGLRLLLRSTRNTYETARKQWPTELVCEGVARLEVTQPVPTEHEEGGMEIQFTERPVPVPDELYVRLYSGEGERPFFERLIQLR